MIIENREAGRKVASVMILDQTMEPEESNDV